jgi:hypothetical protein
MVSLGVGANHQNRETWAAAGIRQVPAAGKAASCCAHHRPDIQQTSAQAEDGKYDAPTFCCKWAKVGFIWTNVVVASAKFSSCQTAAVDDAIFPAKCAIIRSRNRKNVFVNLQKICPVAKSVRVL